MGQVSATSTVLIDADPEERFDLSKVYPELTEALGAIIDRFPKGEPLSSRRGGQGRRQRGQGSGQQRPRQQQP